MNDNMRSEYDKVRINIEKYSANLVELLIKKDLTISVAESCTGGMIASAIVDVPDASKCFNEGHITYSNGAKMKYLEVSNVTLTKYGAVSRETVNEMATGLKKNSSADITVVTSGIAGPTGGSDEKPVGLVYIAVAYNEKVFVSEYKFNGDRTMVRLKATLEAIKLTINALDM